MIEKFGPSCFSEHMIEKILKIRANFRDVAPAPFMLEISFGKM